MYRALHIVGQGVDHLVVVSKPVHISWDHVIIFDADDWRLTDRKGSEDACAVGGCACETIAGSLFIGGDLTGADVLDLSGEIELFEVEVIPLDEVISGDLARVIFVYHDVVKVYVRSCLCISIDTVQ